MNFDDRLRRISGDVDSMFCFPFDELTGMDPWEEMARLQRDVDSLFRTAPISTTTDRPRITDATTTTVWRPDADMKSTKDEVIIEVELPGIAKEDIQLCLGKKGVLTISGERKELVLKENERYLRNEKWYGPFRRSFVVSEFVSEDNIKAIFGDGLLTISYPNPTKATALPKQISL